MSRQRWMIGALLLVTGVAWAPVGAVLVASAAANALDCRLDEGSVHPCQLGGMDIGPALYALGVSGWLILAAFPLMLLTVIAWLGVVLWAIVGRFRRPRAVG